MTMKSTIRTIIEAIGIVSFLFLAFMLYLRLEASPEPTVGPYEPWKPIILSDTTGTWPEPDSMFTYDDGLCIGYTYKQ